MNKSIKNTFIAFAILSMAMANVSEAGMVYADNWSLTGYVISDNSNHYFALFKYAELATIKLFGDGNSDIDLWVYDETGDLVAKSTGLTNEEYIRFYPANTGIFKIVVENRHKPKDSAYLLSSN